MPLANRFLLAALCASSVVLGASAQAGNFQASPVRVQLDGKAKSALVTLTNRGNQAVRLQVDVFRWSETTTGEAALEPTQDIVAFPSLLELAVGESRVVRVGSTRPIEAREQTYRMVIEELPDESGTAQGVSIRMRMSLPVFVVGADAAPAPRLDMPTMDAARVVHVSAFNDGQRHVKSTAIIATLVGADGSETLQRIAGWYLLSGQRRDYTFTVPAEHPCVREIKVRLELDGGDIERADPVVDRGCVAATPRHRG